MGKTYSHSQSRDFDPSAPKMKRANKKRNKEVHYQQRQPTNPRQTTSHGKYEVEE